MRRTLRLRRPSTWRIFLGIRFVIQPKFEPVVSISLIGHTPSMEQHANLPLTRFLGLATIVLAAPASAAPPPPAVSPPGLENPVDGYDMREPYQLWRYWVESQKGPVTEALLSELESLEGLQHYGRILRFKNSGDFGHYLTGEIRAYCQPKPGARFTPMPDTCIYVLRRAFVPLDAASYGDARSSNPLAAWTLANFDAESLARHFRKMALPPHTNWWTTDRDAMFAAAPSPRAVLTENAVVRRIDTNQCPQMASAIIALEGKPLGAIIDIAAVGDDAELRPPRPHAVTTSYTIHLRAEDGPYTIEGSGGPALQMANQILREADACELPERSAN